MRFFVDTADMAEVKSLAFSGLFGGATARSSVVAKIGKKFADDVDEMRAVDPSGMMRERRVPREPPAGKALDMFMGGWPEPGQTIA